MGQYGKFISKMCIELALDEYWNRHDTHMDGHSSDEQITPRVIVEIIS